MTGHAGTDDLGVIYDNAWLPESGAVTVLTGIRRLNMGQAFAGCLVAVVTVNTISNNIGVIENSGSPADRLVTIVTGFAGNDVIR